MNPDELTTILDRIAKGQHTDHADLFAFAYHW